MNEKEFRESLPAVTVCAACGSVLTNIAWSLARHGQSGWVGLGVTKCEACSLVRVAAVGSDDKAHAYAKLARLRFIQNTKS